MKKGILCIIDGMTDVDFCLPDYPAINALPRRNMVRTVPPGRSPDSLICILTLLGYQDVPANLRGYADALGAGIPVHAKDLVCRASWVTLDRSGTITGIANAPGLFTPVQGISYHPLGAYRSLLVLSRQAHLLDKITTYPPHGCLGRSLEAVMPQGCDALQRVVECSHSQRLCLMPWGQSVPHTLTPFPFKGAVITGCDVVRGIARMVGLTLLPVQGATGDIDTDLAAKVRAALQAAAQYPFVLLHINGADEAAHRRNPSEKHQFLKQVDQLVVAPLSQSPFPLYITSDHATCPLTGNHQGTWQPIWSTMA